jgi:hypothetical protein
MTDTLLLALVVAASAAAIVWSVLHVPGNWEHRTDQDILWREIRRELDRREGALFKHCIQVEHRLDRHHRILQYLARRLS